MRAPSALIAGSPLVLPVALVIWVRVFVAIVNRKTSLLPSGLPPVRFAPEMKAMRVPSELIAGSPPDPVLGVIWARVLVVVSNRKT